MQGAVNQGEGVGEEAEAPVRTGRKGNQQWGLALSVILLLCLPQLNQVALHTVKGTGRGTG